MSPITITVLAFSLFGAADYLLGNKIGVGKEFEKAFSLFCPMALSMLGMIVVAPAIGVWLSPVFEGFYNAFGIDPSIIPASLFANDMGGAPLSKEIALNEDAAGLGVSLGTELQIVLLFGSGERFWERTAP